MQSIYGLNALVDKYATAIEKLNLEGDQLEEYSTVLLHLQNQIETGEPSDKIVNECIEWLRHFTMLVQPVPEGNAA